MERSEEAPAHWREDLTEAEIRKRVIETNSDVVCFQELPGMVPFVESHDLAPANTISHSGTIATIVRKSMVKQMTAEAVGRFAVLTTFHDIGLTIANVHWESGQDGADKRASMAKAIVDRCKTNSLLIVGDTNSRLVEEKTYRSIGLVGQRPPKPTWDSRKNGFRKTQRKTHRSFTAYFTRYFHNSNCHVHDVRVFDTPIQVESNRFFLSDHFALGGVVECSAHAVESE